MKILIPLFTLAVVAAVRWPAARAEVRLLTGDAEGRRFAEDCRLMDVSSDGNRILFRTSPPQNETAVGITAPGLYIRDLAAGTLRPAALEPSDPSDSSVIVSASLSDDGRQVAWHTADLNVFWRDTGSGETRWLNAGAPGTSYRAVLSADGRYVAFASTARTMVTNPATLPAVGRAAVHLYDSVGKTMTVVSVRQDGSGLSTGVGSSDPGDEFDLSADGNWVVFSTDDLGAHPDRAAVPFPFFSWIYRRNLRTGEMEPVVRNAEGLVPFGSFTRPRCDGTGNRVLFLANSVGIDGRRLVPEYAFPGGTDLYVREMDSGAVWWVNRTVDGGFPSQALAIGSAALSWNGRVAAFGSRATNYVAEETDPPESVDGGRVDLFRSDLGAGGTSTVTLMTRPVHGNENVSFFFEPLVSGDGRYVAFISANPLPLLGEGPALSIWEHGIGVGDVTPASVDGYDGWAAALPEGARGRLDIPFGDRLSNLEKFVFGLPAAPWAGGGVPTVALRAGSELGVVGDDRPFLTVDVPARPGLPTGYGVRIRSAESLEALPASVPEVTPTGPVTVAGGVEWRRYVHPVPAWISGGQGYLGIEVFGPDAVLPGASAR